MDEIVNTSGVTVIDLNHPVTVNDDLVATSLRADTTYTYHLRKVPGSYKINVYDDMTFNDNSHSLRVGKIYVNEFSSREDAL